MTSLSYLLENAVTVALSRPKQVQHIALRHGLGIELYVDENGVNHLMLYRPAVFPSESEWDAVLRAYPNLLLPAQLPRPEQASSIRRKALIARWAPPRLEF
jgi:hypothetical protein